MAGTYPCGKCGAKGPYAVIEALKNANPTAPRCGSCESPIDKGGKSLESLLAVKS